MIRSYTKNRFIVLYLLVIVTMFIGISLISINVKADKSSNNDLTLRIYNWQDYIDEGLDDDGNKVSDSIMESWEQDYKKRTGKTVKVEYNTFETNEYMLNVLKTGSEHYDLVCPSDYFIQKMISENMLEKLDYNKLDGYSKIENYNLYGSKYVKSIFEKNTVTNKTTNENLTWANYAIPYMWGTMGFVYDSSKVTRTEAATWDILWNTKFAKKSTAKNSVHDTYVAGVMYVFKDELLQLKNDLEQNKISSDQYNNKITEIMNRYDDETLKLVEQALIEMKNNFYGFEVDNGKTDIQNGTIEINFAWSGDAVYSMNTCDESSKAIRLDYAVPVEGSNVFFDGWVMPKGSNTELAQDFLNFICKPENASRNMDVIGYTSCIAGDEIWDLCNEWYQADGDEECDAVDLTYFFGGTLSDDRLTDGRCIIYVSKENRGRQFDAQYPSEETLLRCGVMEDFGDQNQMVLTMWENIKGGESTIWLWIGLGIVGLVIIAYCIYKVNSKNVRRKRRRRK